MTVFGKQREVRSKESVMKFIKECFKLTIKSLKTFKMTYDSMVQEKGLKRSQYLVNYHKRKPCVTLGKGRIIH